ncbi:tetratricopeptide repeat protein [Leptolyngbya sp. NIES-2104]|uniref:tetratricopeptide repeat protein n=1 Tax=Leptolyngbya sp. NIES-2104 TaxID=1552121 RepID=UPI0006ECC358|nr:tetratricopeptide repeat protein [Leptolyngbya sp. NIES-2104]GAP95147.1 TPR repeat [Leptolyngbya sp. NIES-2104]
MQTIEIRQTTGFNAIVSIAGSQFEITVSDPFVEQDEQLLEWYFEEWIKFPFSDSTIAKRAADSVRSYGEALFRQVFRDADAYVLYKSLKLSELEIVIAGDPEFQGLHWEAMQDPKMARPLSIDCVMVRQRRIRGAANLIRVEPSTVLNLLIMTARPNEENDVGYRTISRPMVEAIRDAQLAVNVEIVRPGTYEAFVRHLEAKPEGFYHVVHFDLHGGLMSYEAFQSYSHGTENYTFQRGYGLGDVAAYDGVKAFLFFEGEAAGQAVPVMADELAERLQGRGIPVCILNACQSGKQVQQDRVDERETSLGARLMDAGMQMVVAMGYGVTVDAAKVLMQRVYQEMFAGEKLPIALRAGRRELFEHKKRRMYFNQEEDLEDWLLPVVYGNQAIEFHLREMTFAEQEAYYARQATQYRFAGVTYEFVGRDLDILKLEKGLLRHGVVLVQGMGGTGKTTLLRYLQEWWVQTSFVDRVFYFGYDTRAWTLEQMSFAIAGEMLPDGEMRQWQAMRGEARIGRLIQVLRSRRCGLMLDNLESVTGEALAIPNTLPLEEQEKIREFLARIAGGRSIVLLGSRGREAWLQLVYRDRYELRGLDQEARSQLAKLVLARQVVDRVKREAILADREFKRLMRLLAGYPLVIEVVLANLKRQTVAEVLAGLDFGDVGLDRVGGRTESILKCVEYSHSNLSEEAQKLLLCLAPFSGFVRRDVLWNYAQELQKLEPFQNYPFEQFDSAVQGAINWGLLASLFENEPRLLSIQPMFPYFLKTRLAEQGQVTCEALREGFKNHYLGLAGFYYQLMKSKDAQERQLGIFFCQLEYENLYSALQICLKQQASILIFGCLDKYFELIHNVQSALALAEEVSQSIERYPQQWKTEAENREYIVALNLIAYCYLKTRRYDQAKQSYLKELQANQAIGDRYSQARTYDQLGRVAQELHEYEEARNNYQQALQIKIEFNDRYSQASTHHNLGNVAQELHEYEEARNNLRQALKIFVEFNDRYSQACTYHHLGIVAEMLCEYEEARGNHQQALQIKIEFNDRYSQSSTYHHLGRVAEELREYEEARGNYQQALQIKIEFNDRYSQSSTYHHLGRVAEELHEYEEARNNYQQALQICVEHNDRYNQAETYYQLGIIAGKLREYEEARINYQQALQVYVEYNDRYSQARTYYQLGKVAELTGELEEAKANYMLDLEITAEFNDEHGLSIALRNLAQFYQTTQDPELVSTVAQLLNASVEEVEDFFNQTE